MENTHLFFSNCPVVGTRVKTPMGDGYVIGHIARGSYDIKPEVVVSLNRYPFESMDRGGSMVIADSFRLDQVEVVTK